MSYSKSALRWAIALSICFSVSRAYAEQQKLSQNVVACGSKEVRYRLAELMAQNDTQAALSLYQRSGCTLIPSGTTVDVENWSVVGPLTLDCLRPPGLPDCYWSVRDDGAVRAPERTQTEQAPAAPAAPSPPASSAAPKPPAKFWISPQ
jgi:hypothetical protein